MDGVHRCMSAGTAIAALAQVLMPGVFDTLVTIYKLILLL